MRWALGKVVHPDAVAYAKELEARGYVQAHPEQLRDREGVIVMSGHDGSHAPARYYRKGTPDGGGLRTRHEFESWPDSPHAERIAYAEGANGDNAANALGVFRLTDPKHMNDIAEMYDGRIRRHREESQAQASA